jgi:hypothetical protein
MAVGDVLDLHGRDVLATADDDFLESPGDEEESVVVDVAEVAGAQNPSSVKAPRVRSAIRQYPGVTVTPRSWTSPSAPMGSGCPRRSTTRNSMIGEMIPAANGWRSKTGPLIAAPTDPDSVMP